MALIRLLINDFRNINHFDQKVAPRFNYIIGDNGSGKTSFLEALYYLGHGRSFRTALTKRIIKDECSQFQLYVQSEKHHLGIQKDTQGDTIVKIDQVANQKLVHLAKHLPIQLIHPDGFELLTNGPKLRRNFIDWGLFHHQPMFHKTWSRLQRLFKQRHILLKQATDYNQLLSWDYELVQLADQIDQWRQAYILNLSEKVISFCQSFLPELPITISYYRGWERDTDYAEILAHNFERDQNLGYTSAGPNKADLRIKSQQVPVADHLSRGQLKLLLCALRLAQGVFYTEHTANPCIYLIDDFSSELDATKRQLLFSILEQIKAQVFISAIAKNGLEPFISEKIEPLQDKIWMVNNGLILDSDFTL